jgi:RNA 2',3'-cyclic 3'-phosphodiesterase
MSRGATARLFVAVDPPAQACEELAAWARGVGSAVRAAGGARDGLRLLDAESLHLTVCFLGSRPVGEIDAIAGALADCARHAGEHPEEHTRAGGAGRLSVGAPLWLPPQRPNALAVEVHDHDGALARVHEQVNAAVSSACGWQRERRRFRPHITLARVRGGVRSRRGGDPVAQPLPATPRLRFGAERLVLYRSWLDPAGASYEALASSALEAAVREP